MSFNDGNVLYCIIKRTCGTHGGDTHLWMKLITCLTFPFPLKLSPDNFCHIKKSKERMGRERRKVKEGAKVD